MNDLKSDLKAQIIEQLNLENLTPDEIIDDAPLFGDNGLGLDSIDALEFIVLLDTQYGIKIQDPAAAREIFHSIDTIANYIVESRKV